MNNTVNKLILDRGSCEKLHKKFRLADPVFITSGLSISSKSVISRKPFSEVATVGGEFQMQVLKKCTGKPSTPSGFLLSHCVDIFEKISHYI